MSNNVRMITMKELVSFVVLRKNGETICSCCKTPCQGFKDPTGRILCYDCYKKILGTAP